MTPKELAELDERNLALARSIAEQAPQIEAICRRHMRDHKGIFPESSRTMTVTILLIVYAIGVGVGAFCAWLVLLR